ncbi:hypothetical protein GF339_03465 [candidate division KSB3 bacterium]|uniref:Glutamine amidotransferase type-2 domain-containing protein n=1 Tax=candidate division KSB3 bacterium TaxID=2044937 RepID=A0A9D5JTA5_9BACT|nr:hypothetical protein [candidate division KSB3 bacterium]MBD3323616.1 hypothetical protein [candidate division KSB3 bacterium]
MCELFGLSCNKKVSISFSFMGLADASLAHESGWGIGFYRTGNDTVPPYATIVKEPISARNSIFNYFLKYGYIQSHIFVSHFRVASVGVQVPLNTHPFQLMVDPRSDTLQEKSWIFAHSGTMRGIKEDPRFQTRVITPHGNTDSEHVFCYLIEQLRQAYVDNGFRLSRDEKIQILETSAAALSAAYPDSLNFLLSDGKRIYAYYGGYDGENGLWYLTRIPPHQKLAMLDQHDGMTFYLVDNISDETVSLIASNPLIPASTGEWKKLAIHTLKVFENGNVVH